MDDVRSECGGEGGLAAEERRGIEAWLGSELGEGEGARRRIERLILPVLSFCAARARGAARRPVVVGISAPQGAGKSTLAAQLERGLGRVGLRAAAVSIDDFYLTHEEQRALAAAHPGNPYLEHRGYPGTHDVALGVATLDALRALAGEGDCARVPIYDKSRHGGRGDRAAPDRDRVVRGPLDLVLVEGWMLGFAAPPRSSLGPLGPPDDPWLAPIDAALAAYAAWDARIDAMVVLRALDPESVLRWRVEAEEAMKAAGRPGLSRAQIEDYVRRFLPAYRRYAETVPGVRWPDGARLVLRLGEDRLPVAGDGE